MEAAGRLPRREPKGHENRNGTTEDHAWSSVAFGCVEDRFETRGAR